MALAQFLLITIRWSTNWASSKTFEEFIIPHFQRFRIPYLVAANWTVPGGVTVDWKGYGQSLICNQKGQLLASSHSDPCIIIASIKTKPVWTPIPQVLSYCFNHISVLNEMKCKDLTTKTVRVAAIQVSSDLGTTDKNLAKMLPLCEGFVKSHLTELVSNPFFFCIMQKLQRMEPSLLSFQKHQFQVISART